MTESGHSSSQTPGWMLELAFMRATFGSWKQKRSACKPRNDSRTGLNLITLGLPQRR